MEDAFKITTLKVIAILLLVSFVGSIYYFISQPEVECDICDECETCLDRMDDKSILDVSIYDWGYDESNPQDILFDFFIMNYGNIEAKNIAVTCSLDDSSGNHIFSIIDLYGNLASRSVELGEFIEEGPNNMDMYEEYSAYCYVSDCDNCEILYERIPELAENY